ncbi:uncharacterized protein GGS22DRAFT_183182 [Annulohypoxylon maeteangense]|uniref:uncharacterized protein n=1 Tax=Annulohypoxylon maeteangense TaxID=1927788 RepID=UPI00200870A7|nr:uncharacterized protein GGS22DRAFT_183182 [Annulohypoxylon maeteangense]KAI0889837.1 hypothetical protein GGS22DRAFT_183182 [Annulohypoxylon maeteangense]
MDPSTLFALPTELISQICDILYHTHPSSLLNFARSNKACYTIASAFFSRTIWIFAAEPEDLITVVQEHLERLHRLGALGCVRRLVIYGPGVDCPNRDTPPDSSAPMAVADLEGRFDNPRLSFYLFDESPVEKVHEFDNRWLPLVDLIRQLPSLADLIYQCPGQFPPCLLQALHEHLPKCRLHIDNFYLRSLVANPPIADPYEFMIATSPCLYSISIAAHHDDKSAPSHHVGAVFRLVSGLAPNLKEVHLFRNKKWKWNADQEHSSFFPPWGNLPISKACPGVLGSLSCLQLWGPDDEGSSITDRVITDWSMHTDFTVLRVLRINSVIGEDVLNNLVNGSHNFRSLETLVLTLRHTGELAPVARVSSLTEMLVCDLQGLHTLEIIGWCKKIAISTKLSPKLRSLRLRPCYDQYLTWRDITNIRARCPMIENLDIPLLRTKGDANEVALYEALGTLPKLEDLALDLYVPFRSCRSGEEVPRPKPYFDDFDRELLTGFNFLKGHVRDVFINNAVDGTLVRAIFETISGVKGRYNLGRLERLKIDAGGNRCLSIFSNKFQILRKYGVPLYGTWQVDRNPRDDSRQVLITKRLKQKNRELEERQHNEVDQLFPEIVADPSEVESIFRRIWPERWEGSDWWDDWYSFPLSKSTS